MRGMFWLAASVAGLAMQAGATAKILREKSDLKSIQKISVAALGVPAAAFTQQP